MQGHGKRRSVEMKKLLIRALIGFVFGGVVNSVVVLGSPPAISDTAALSREESPGVDPLSLERDRRQAMYSGLMRGFRWGPYVWAAAHAVLAIGCYLSLAAKGRKPRSESSVRRWFSRKHGQAS